MSRYLDRKEIPRALAALVSPPYRLRVDDHPTEDIGWLAELLHGENTIKALELYPYTVQGPGASRSPDERRIQLEISRRAGIPREPPPGRVGVMIGFRDRDLDGTSAQALIVCFAFGIWGRATARNSIQFNRELLEQAELFGAAAFSKVSTALGNPTRGIIMAIRPDVFPFFLVEMADDFAGPQAWDNDAVQKMQTAARNYYSAHSAYELADETQERGMRLRREVTQPIRDRRFAEAVKRTYNYQCALCSYQLGLVEAAHIDPVADPESTDDVQNGIALCPLHHTAYDAGIIK